MISASTTAAEGRQLTLATLRGLLADETRAQPHLAALRGFNQLMVGELNKCFPVAGSTMLDLSASIHGYALEAALDLGAARYEGIDLDVSRHWGASPVEVTADDGRPGRLREMNAERLDFADATFDCLLTISTFEHFHHPDAVLREMFRVLKPGGAVLASFEPVWTASYGHHLHHLGAVSDLVPPGSHLYLGPEQMRDVLARQIWPADAAVDREEALRWIYEGGGINRHSLPRLKAFFEQSPFTIEWLAPIPDESTPERAVVTAYLARVLPYSADDLLTRGLSLLLRKH